MSSAIAKESFNNQSEGEKVMSSIGMIILLISFSMLFLTLFMGYAVYRLTATTWPPMGMSELPRLQAHFSTGLIITSSIGYYFFEHKKKVELLFITLFLGVLFVFSQFALWQGLKELGIYAGTGIFASIIYGYTWTHAAHMLLGLIALSFLIFKLKLSGKNVAQTLIENVGMFWHFLAIIWLVMYTLIFLI